MNRILVLGSTNIDLIARVSHLPLPGETVGQAEFMQANGGKGANQAVSVARLGGDVGFVTCLGNDSQAKLLRQQFLADGINLDGIIITNAAPTGTALIFVADNAENCIAVAPGANDRITPTDIDALESYITKAEFMLLQLEIPMCVVQYAISKAVTANVKVVLNPAPATDLSDDLLHKLYLITPNRTECEALTGLVIQNIEDAKKAADILLSKGVKNVIITLGREGALLKNQSICALIPALQVQAVDTTAAGDVFNGALLVALAEGCSLLDAARFATAASSIAVTRMGAQPSIPWRKEVDKLVKRD
ncbi:MAG: ribokinase [Alistipes sp.]